MVRIRKLLCLSFSQRKKVSCFLEYFWITGIAKDKFVSIANGCTHIGRIPFLPDKSRYMVALTENLAAY